MHPTQSTTKRKKQTNPNPNPAPPPYYLTSANPPAYCHTCGRVISSKRNTKTSEPTSASSTKSNPKFCSDRCKRHKPSTSPASAEVHVEKALVALLEGQTPPAPFVKSTADSNVGAGDEAQNHAAPPPLTASLKKKGESRVLLPLSILEEAVFGPRKDPERSYGRRRNRAFRGVRGDGEWRSVDMEDDHDGEDEGRGKVRPEPISTWDGAEDFEGEVDGGVALGFSGGGEEEVGEHGVPETPEMEARRRAGQRRAEEREFVRCVVRRAVVFGVEVEGWKGVGGGGGAGRKKKGKGKGAEEDQDGNEGEGKEMRKCEAVMDGQMVEPSFAKGDWSVRWRDE